MANAAGYPQGGMGYGNDAGQSLYGASIGPTNYNGLAQVTVPGQGSATDRPSSMAIEFFDQRAGGLDRKYIDPTKSLVKVWRDTSQQRLVHPGVLNSLVYRTHENLGNQTEIMIMKKIEDRYRQHATAYNATKRRIMDRFTSFKGQSFMEGLAALVNDDRHNSGMGSRQEDFNNKVRRLGEALINSLVDNALALLNHRSYTWLDIYLKCAGERRRDILELAEQEANMMPEMLRQGNLAPYMLDMNGQRASSGKNELNTIVMGSAPYWNALKAHNAMTKTQADSVIDMKKGKAGLFNLHSAFSFETNGLRVYRHNPTQDREPQNETGGNFSYTQAWHTKSLKNYTGHVSQIDATETLANNYDRQRKEPLPALPQSYYTEFVRIANKWDDRKQRDGMSVFEFLVQSWCRGISDGQQNPSILSNVSKHAHAILNWVKAQPGAMTTGYATDGTDAPTTYNFEEPPPEDQAKSETETKKQKKLKKKATQNASDSNVVVDEARLDARLQDTDQKSKAMKYLSALGEAMVVNDTTKIANIKMALNSIIKDSANAEDLITIKRATSSSKARPGVGNSVIVGESLSDNELELLERIMDKDDIGFLHHKFSPMSFTAANVQQLHARGCPPIHAVVYHRLVSILVGYMYMGHVSPSMPECIDKYPAFIATGEVVMRTSNDADEMRTIVAQRQRTLAMIVEPDDLCLTPAVIHRVEGGGMRLAGNTRDYFSESRGPHKMYQSRRWADSMAISNMVGFIADAWDDGVLNGVVSAWGDVAPPRTTGASDRFSVHRKEFATFSTGRTFYGPYLKKESLGIFRSPMTIACDGFTPPPEPDDMESRPPMVTRYRLPPIASYQDVQWDCCKGKTTQMVHGRSLLGRAPSADSSLNMNGFNATSGSSRALPVTMV